MLILSGGNANYKIFLNELKKDCKKFGYPFKEIKVPDDLTTDFTPNVYKAKIKAKPDIILGNLEEGLNVYLDCDVRILKDFSEIEKESFDIAITVREERHQCGRLLNQTYPHITGYLNAGVIFLRKNKKTEKFINEWIAEKEYTQTGSDQERLTNILRRNTNTWSGKVNILGAKVLFIPMSIYNSKEDGDDVKIRHYAGTYKEKLKYYK